MSHVYDGKERPDSGPFRRPEEYSVAVWPNLGLGMRDITERPRPVFECCYGFKEGTMDNRKTAGALALTRAINDGLIKPGDAYSVDVSEDASDEWETVLSGTYNP